MPVLRRSSVRLAVLAGSTAGAVAVFLAVAQPGRLAASLGSLPLTAVLAAVAATMAGVMLVAVRWRSLLAAGGIDAPAPRLFAALTMGSAVNNLVPARGGDVVRVESAHQLTGASRLAIAGTMLSERILDAFVLALLVVTGALLSGIGGAFLWIGTALAAGIAVAAFALGRVPWGRSPRNRTHPGAATWTIVRPPCRRPWGRLASLEAGLAVFRVPRQAAPALLATAAIWFADVVMYAALARGFDLDLSLGALLLLVGAGNLALAIPGTAAGLGSFELVTLAGAHGIGLGGADLAAFVLAVHAVIVLPTTVTGLLLARTALPRAFQGAGKAGRHTYRTSGVRSSLPEPSVSSTATAPCRS